VLVVRMLVSHAVALLVGSGRLDTPPAPTYR
jgi:hypothetical protein